MVDCGSLNHGKQKPWLGEVGRRAATVKWLMCLSPSLRCEFLSWKAHVLVISDSLMPATVPVRSQEEGSFELHSKSGIKRSRSTEYWFELGSNAILDLSASSITN